MTTRPPVYSLLTRRRLVILLLLVALLAGLVALYIAAPLNQLNVARTRWASQHITDYRIVVNDQFPLYQCQEDFEVRNEQITYKHKDECASTLPIGANPAPFTPFIVSNLFKRVEDGYNSSACGPNGCACDGPVGLDVVYDPERGYPQQLIYRLMPELRWRYLDYWRARLSGNFNCPLNPKSALPSYGQTITVISVTPLKPEKPESNLGNLLLTPTAAPG